MAKEARGEVNVHMSPLLARVEGFVRRLLAEPERARRGYPVVLLLLTLAVWFPALFAGLDVTNPDSFYHITQAALHHSPSEVADWFVRGYWAYTHYEYRPLTRVSLLLDYLAWGRRPLGFHLTNVLLHFVCAAVLAAAMVRMGAPVWAARLTGALAVVFPQGQMAVTWINGRQDVLCAALALGAVLLLLNWLAGRPWPHLVGAAALTFLSALAKEPGAVTPMFMLAAALLVPTQRGLRTRLLAVALIAAPLGLYGFLRLQAWPMDQYVKQNANQLRPLAVSVDKYFGEVLAPRLHELWFLWRRMGIHVAFSPRFPRLFVEQVAFWAGLVVLLRRHRRLLALALVWKTAFFLPVHNLYWNPAFTHYCYLPNFGTVWLAGLAAWELSAYAAARMRRQMQTAARWSLVALGLLVLIGYYYRQVELKWPDRALLLKGGPRPPAAFCRSLQGPEVPFDFGDEAVALPEQ